MKKTIIVISVLALFLGITSYSAKAQYDNPLAIVSAKNAERYGSEKLIVWNPEEEPAVVVKRAYSSESDKPETVSLDVYELPLSDFLSALVYEKSGEYSSVFKRPNISRLSPIASFETTTEKGRVVLPVKGLGYWLLRASGDSGETFTLIARTALGTLAREGDGEIIFWTQDLITRKSVSGGTLDMYSLEGSLQKTGSYTLGSDGVARVPIAQSGQNIAVVSSGGKDSVLVLYNPATYDSYEKFALQEAATKYFLFTDRPLYKPGDTVYFKSLIRTDKDALYSIPSGVATVKAFKNYDREHPIFEGHYPVSPNGTIDGFYKLPESAGTGYYQLEVEIGSPTDREYWLRGLTSFDVQYFRKPEYSLDVSVATEEYLLGDKASFTIQGDYFFGAPLSNVNVEYKVSAVSFYDYYQALDEEEGESKLDSYYYGYWYGSEVEAGTAVLNKDGVATVQVDTKKASLKGPFILTLEARYVDASGNPVLSKKNILVRDSEYALYQTNYFYGAKKGQAFSIPLKLVSSFGAPVGGVDVTISPKRSTWNYRDVDKSYFEQTKTYDSFHVLIGPDGTGVASFVPDEDGSYQLTATYKDRRGNIGERTFYVWVSSGGYYYRSDAGSQELSLQFDKKRYAPGEVALVTIGSKTSGGDVFLSLERDRVRRYFVVPLSGNSKEVPLAVIGTDLPNVFVTASTFTSNGLSRATEKLTVSKDGKKVSVSVIPSSKTYAPGEVVRATVLTTDSRGVPLPAEVTVWAVDKAIYELMSERRPDIFSAFWADRYNSTISKDSFEGLSFGGGAEKGCFAGDTLVLTPKGEVKISELREGDIVLTHVSENNPTLREARVTKLHKADVQGYLILNGHLKVTPEHKIFVNGNWSVAGNIQFGDTLIDSKGNAISVTSVEWQAGTVPVYNIEVEGAHTYIANGIYVHNGKGGGAARQDFKDVAYWNPRVQTDVTGRATVTFKLPDNLTTWHMMGVAITPDTRVGEASVDIVSTKSFLVRPVLPNILRLGDEVTISALVHNFTGVAEAISATFGFTKGAVVPLQIAADPLQSGSVREVFAKLIPGIAGEGAVTISAQLLHGGADAKDAVVSKIPVIPFGFKETLSYVGEKTAAFVVGLHSDARPDTSVAKLYLSPSLFGTVAPAINYLLDYAYGCVEQTTSRFVPAVIVRENQALFASVTEGKDLGSLMEAGVKRLELLRDVSGGWGWWGGEVNPFITAYVVEYAKRADAVGANVPSELYSTTRNRFEREIDLESDPARKIAYQRTLSLLGSPKGKLPITEFGSSTPDVVALALLTNLENGYTNKSTNGYQRLMSSMLSEGDTLSWEAGDWRFFGSSEASTALALRALTLARAPKDTLDRIARSLVKRHTGGYWHNTFATAQTIDALSEYTKYNGESGRTPTFSVLLDGVEISSGAFATALSSRVVDLSLKAATSTVSVVQRGDVGTVYSTLVVDEFRTATTTAPQGNGLTVYRNYSSRFGVGDEVEIRIRVTGIPTDSHYLVVEDQLPSGLIPINERFENEDSSNYYYSRYGYWGEEQVTQNGMVFSFENVYENEVTVSYRARIVSRGVFNTPPATAALMYDPGVSGRSGTFTLTIDDSRLSGEEIRGDDIGGASPLFATPSRAILGVVGVLALFSLLYVVLTKRLKVR